jgi:3-deoxy-D-manno-octulosonic-acid transferase
VSVTGNIKFDAMRPAAAAAAEAPLRLALRQRRQGPVIVAGSVSEPSDQRAILTAFAMVRSRAPSALLILAPRHPEERDRMVLLETLLREFGLEHQWRSRSAPDSAVQGPVLILDTMGELRDCYAEASWAFVGTDHNVLEPLGFGKPVFVTGGWEPTYPSYPVYRHLLDAGALHEVVAIDALGPAWVAQIDRERADSAGERERIEAVLVRMRGAVERNLAALRDSGVLRVRPPGARTSEAAP